MTRFMASASLLLAYPLIASAHGIGIEARLKGGRVMIEAYFDDDSPAADAKVIVTDESGKTVVEGKSDNKGAWSFDAPLAGKYRASVDAGGGHLARTTFTIPPKVVSIPESTNTPPKEIVVSDGPTRASFTGPMKWVMAVVGLGILAMLAFLGRLLVRKQSGHSPREAVR